MSKLLLGFIEASWNLCNEWANKR